jgi:hypothetical protein
MRCCASILLCMEKMVRSLLEKHQDPGKAHRFGNHRAIIPGKVPDTDKDGALYEAPYGDE